MIKVTFKVPQAVSGPADTFLEHIKEPRTIDADDVSLYEGWAVFNKYVPIEGERFKDSLFIEAIRLDRIDSLVRVES